ncbi:hypothetical protein GCM10027443_20650 [Pontibacter brevis]
MKKLGILLSMLLLISCEKEESEQIPIDSDILIEVKEVGSDPKRIVIVGKTEKEYNCYNNTIVTNKRFTQKTIEITFKAVEGDTKCATAMGPATTEIDLGALDNGEYSLQLNTTTTKNEGLLKLTTTEIILEYSQQEGIDILTPVVQR